MHTTHLYASALISFANAPHYGCRRPHGDTAVSDPAHRSLTRLSAAVVDVIDATIPSIDLES